MKSELFNLEGKNVILFGGSGILGKQFAKVLVEHNAKVISCDIRESDEKIISDSVEYIIIDANKEENLLKLRTKLLKKYGHIDVIVNSLTAKYDDFYLPFEDVSVKGWEVGMKGNLTVPFMICKTFIKQMVKQKSGSIINISSVYGLVGNDQRIYEGANLHELYVKKSPNLTQVYSHGVYNASKGGLINFTRYLAAYYGKDNIRVNTISPGGIEYPGENKTFLKKYGAKTPLGRKAKQHEINGALIFLASDASSYVTGHNLVVDGGFTCW